MPTIQERLAAIETKIDFIRASVSAIENNHLPHIYERLDALESCNAVNKSWTRFAKPIFTGVLIIAVSSGLTYFWVKLCGG